MVMEAMRLSLVEHEERQRREAANGDQILTSNPELTPIANDTAAPAPPSVALSLTVSESGSGGNTPTASASPIPATLSFVNPSTTVAYGRPGSNHSVENASASSRPLTPVASPPRRTPSPENQRPSDNLQAPHSSSSSWHRGSPSSRSFSTISAAISTTSTATAIPKGRPSSYDDTTTSTSGSSSTPGATSTPPASTNPPATTSIPSPPFRESVNVVVAPIRPPAIHTASSTSSIFSVESAEQTSGSQYDCLGSSPDSEFSREPLLGSSYDTPTIPESGQPEVPSVLSRAG